MVITPIVQIYLPRVPQNDGGVGGGSEFGDDDAELLQRPEEDLGEIELDISGKFFFAFFLLFVYFVQIIHTWWT